MTCGRLVLAGLVASLPVGALAARAADVLVDRVVAVVDGQLVTLSDVRLARDLGLVDAGDDATARDRLVDRALILGEVARYAPPEPSPADVEGRLADLRARVGEEALARTLRRAGVDEASLRLLVRRELLVEAYLAQRFAVTALPTDEEVESYVLSHQAELTAAAGGRDEAAITSLGRARLTAERRQRLIEGWMDGLRRRAEIDVRPVTP